MPTNSLKQPANKSKDYAAFTLVTVKGNIKKFII